MPKMPFVLFPYFYLHVYSESIQNKKDKRDVKSEPVYFQKISECLRTQFFFLPYLLRPSSFSSSTSTKSSSEHHDDSDSRVVVRPMEGSVKNMERCCYYKVQAVATVKKKKNKSEQSTQKCDKWNNQHQQMYRYCIQFQFGLNDFCMVKQMLNTMTLNMLNGGVL